MDPWVWLAAYLVGFTLLQLLLYRRFRRDVPRGETTTPAGMEGAAPRAAGGGSEADEDVVTCQHCRTANEPEPTYTFCRQCCEPLN